MANNPPITDKSFDYITPDLDIIKLVRILARDKTFYSNVAPLKENEYIGQLIYRSVGNKNRYGTTSPDIVGNADLNHPSADPFRDSDIDNERIRSRGIIARDSIEKRNVLYLQNDEFANLLFLAGQEQADNLATFLIRINHKGEEQPPLDQYSKIIFSFTDQASMRDPYVVLTKEKDQSKTATKPEQKPTAASK